MARLVQIRDVPDDVHRTLKSRAAAAGVSLIELFPSLPLRQRAWALRRNLTVADALFVALAERLDEPLATKDRGLATEAAKHAAVSTLALPG